MCSVKDGFTARATGTQEGSDLPVAIQQSGGNATGPLRGM